jgi:hypothetical protein
LTRLHKFETWFVVWDRALSQVVRPMFRFRRAQGASVTFDHTKPAGRAKRPTFQECNNELTQRTIEPSDAIPANVLRGPSANSHFATGISYRQTHTLPALTLQVT